MYLSALAVGSALHSQSHLISIVLSESADCNLMQAQTHHSLAGDAMWNAAGAAMRTRRWIRFVSIVLYSPLQRLRHWRAVSTLESKCFWRVVSPWRQRFFPLIICAWWIREVENIVQLEKHRFRSFAIYSRDASKWSLILRNEAVFLISPGGSGMMNYLSLSTTARGICVQVAKCYKTIVCNIINYSQRYHQTTTMRMRLERSFIISCKRVRMFCPEDAGDSLVPAAMVSSHVHTVSSDDSLVSAATLMYKMSV